MQLQERKPWNLTKPSNGTNENEVFLGMASKWDSKIWVGPGKKLQPLEKNKVSIPTNPGKKI